MSHDNFNFGKIILCAIKGLACASLITVIGAVTVSIALMNISDPDTLLTPLALLILMISSVAGGSVASRNSEAPIVSALAYAGMHLLLILMLAFFISDGTSKAPVLMKLGTYIALLSLSVLASFIVSIGKGKKKSKLKKKYKR